MSLVGDSNGEESNGSDFDDWAEGVRIVQAIFLIVALCNESSLVSINSAIWLVFEMKDSFTAEDMEGRGTGN